MAAIRRAQSVTTGGAVAPIKPDAWLAKAIETLLPQFDPMDGGLKQFDSGRRHRVSSHQPNLSPPSTLTISAAAGAK